MAWWVYKCNNRNNEYQRAYGDWQPFFDAGKVDAWGSTEWTPQLGKLVRGNMIIAYQTDRNELVGVCRMVGFKRRGQYRLAYLKPVEKVNVKVRPLKEADPRVAAIPALQSGPIMTIYPISDSDAQLLLEAAGAVDAAEDADAQPEEAFIEGERRAANATVRNPGLRAAAKKRWGLKCCCCGFDFETFYGVAARGLAIVHHLELLADANGEQRKATVEDVRVVCANCHYVIHVKRRPMEVIALNKLIAKKWSPWTERGISRRAAHP